MVGTLYLCATPIGNLEDITLRVLRILKEVDLIAAEDTRHSRILLEYYDIHTPMTSYHEHNKYEKAEVLIRKLQEGTNIALITDAGTPGISDPGEVMARRCHEEGICVTSLPGACACITGLTLSGEPSRRFCFEAFLPADKKERRPILEELVTETRTIILYEAPHRLKKTLEELLAVLGNRKLTICRELTKRYEEGEWITLVDAVDKYTAEEPKGEYVLVIEGRSREELERESAASWEAMTLIEHLEYYLDRGMDKKEAMKQMAKDRGCSKREIYQRLLDFEQDE